MGGIITHMQTPGSADIHVEANTLKQTFLKFWPLAILLIVFIVYIPAVRLMPFHDDAVLMPAINGRSLLTIFENRQFGDGHHRPVSYLPWLILRDFYGWYPPALMHMWNIFVHLLNTALVFSMARRIAKRFEVQGVVFPLTTALIFGLYPHSYEAVLWSAALVHPLMTFFGLCSLHAYLQGRDVFGKFKQHNSSFKSSPRGWLNRYAWMPLSLFFILLACLSHEMGFIFGALILGTDLVWAVARRQRINPSAVWLCGLSLIYPLYYRLFLITKWTTESSNPGIFDLSGIAPKVAYQVQGLISWMLILSRGFIGSLDSQSGILVIFGLFVIASIPVVFLLIHQRKLCAGLLGVGLWTVAITPTTLTLSQDYIWSSPRMTYLPSIGAALLWGLVASCLFSLRSNRMFRMILGTLFVVLLAWSVRYISDWLNETERLTPALRLIDADIRISDPAARLLIINSSFVSLRTKPAWLIGQEGMPLWEYNVDNKGPMGAWPGAVSGVERTTTNVRHDISLTNRETRFGASGVTFTRGKEFYFGVFGDLVDDSALRTRILSSNYIYRFDYDDPGFRVNRLAVIGNGAVTNHPLAVISNGTASVALNEASAIVCRGNILFSATWSDIRGFTQPVGVFLHVINPENQQVSVADGDPIGGYLPLDMAPGGIVITETRSITVPMGIVAKSIEIGVYQRNDGRRLQATQADGQYWGSNAVRVPIDAETSACAFVNN